MTDIKILYTKIGRISIIRISDQIGCMIDNSRKNDGNEITAIQTLINPEIGNGFCKRICFFHNKNIDQLIKHLKCNINRMATTKKTPEILSSFKSVKKHFQLNESKPYMTVTIDPISIFAGIYQVESPYDVLCR